MKVLAWTPDLSVKEYPPPPIPEGWVFGKVIAAMISNIDKSFKVGLPTPLGRVAGSFGALRVLEAGVNSRATEGDIYGVIPYSVEGVLGLDINGLMSEYVSAPSDSLIKLESMQLSKTIEMLPLWLEFSFMPHLKEAIKKSVNPLIIGCNFTTYVIAANLLGEKKITVGCISNGFLKEISELGVKAINIAKACSDDFDFVILGVLSSFYTMNVLNCLKSREVTLYLPPDIPAVVLKLPDTLREVIIERAGLSNPLEGLKALSKIKSEVLKKNVVITKNLEEVPHLVKYYSRVVWVPTSWKD